MVAEPEGLSVTLAHVVATLTPSKPMTRAQYTSGMSNAKFNIQVRDDGGANLTGVKIFREGTFKDSMGDQSTWGAEHLAQMVFNFNYLREQGTLTEIPVRRDHSMSIDKVIGYFTDLRHEGGFLVADLDITEPEAVDKFGRGTFRNRSSEIGYYETNSGAFQWPVLLGVAFVDIPAVEGLYSSPAHDSKPHFYSYIPEAPVTTPADTDTQPQAPAPQAASQDHGAPAPPAPQQFFQIEGLPPTNDYAAVQAYITAADAELKVLRGYKKDSIETGRKVYVAKLAEDGKIMAPQITYLEPLVLSMDDEQWANFTKGYDAAPKLTLFQVHGDSVTNPTGVPGGNLPRSAPEPGHDLRVQQEIVANFKRGGRDQKWIEQTGAWAKLKELEAAAAAAS